MIAISHFLIAKFAQITCLQELQFSRQTKYLLRYIFLETNQISIIRVLIYIHISEYIYIYYLRKKVIEAVFDCTWIWDLETCHQYGHLFLGRTYSTSFCVPFLFGTSLIQTLDYLSLGEYLCYIYLDAETLVTLEIQHTSQYKFGI